MIDRVKNKLISGLKKPGLKAGDFVIVAITLAVSFLLWGRVFIFEEAGSVAEISADGTKVAEVRLDTGELSYRAANISDILDEFRTDTVQGAVMIHISSSGVHLTLEVREGRIRFSESDCPDRVCVNTGFISVNGQVAACVPARILVRITGEPDESDPDIIIG